MKIFADSALSFISERPTRSSRIGLVQLLATGLPTTTDEVWRYAPLSELDLDHFDVAADPGGLIPLRHPTLSKSGLVVRVVDGFLVASDASVDGVRVRSVQDGSTLGGGSSLERYANDPLRC